MISGYRWYRAYPTPMTQLLIAAQNALWMGADPISKYPYATLAKVASFESQNANGPVSFCSVRDPALNNGNGGDVLIICGFTSSNMSCATGKFTLTGTPSAGQTITLSFVNGTDTVTLGAYTVLTTDNVESIASALVNLINASAAVTPGTPFLGQAIDTSTADGTTAYVSIGALLSGAAGNSITYSASVTGSGVSVSPGSATAMTGGGSTFSGPLKYDGTTVTALSWAITQPFTNCVTWHDHVWLWGDPSNPDTVYATDINQPEGFTFMTQEGGYQIGAGDGDPSVRACVPAGNIFYVFKGNNIYAITGYDFQSGEYQFQVQPAVRGYGTPNAQSATTLGNSVIFWSGRAFYRLRAGAFELEPIGRKIPITQGLVALGDQSLVRAVAGDFLVQSNLNEAFSGSSATVAHELFSQVALFAVDTGNGVADTVLVFDDDASQQIGDYAWAKWTGWQVGAWIPFGQGPNAAETVLAEPPLLCWCPDPGVGGPEVLAYGTDPQADNGAPIPWFAQTGWVTMATGVLQKELHRVYLELESTPGAVFSMSVTPSVMATQAGNPRLYNPFQAAFGSTGGATGAEAHQTLVATVTPALRADAYLFGFAESSGASNYELISLTCDYIEEAFPS